MDKKIYLVVGLLIMLIIPTSLAAKATNQWTWKMSTMYTSNHPYYKIIEHFVDTLKKETNGAIEIKVIPGSAAVSPSHEYMAVSTGTVNLSFTPFPYSAGSHPITNFMAFFGWFNYDMWNNIHKDIEKIVNDEFFKEQNVIISICVAVDYLVASRTPIKNVAGLKGLTTRNLGGLSGKLLSVWLDSTPVKVAGTETFVALQRGLLDTSWSPYSRVVADQLWEVAPYALIGSEKGDLMLPVCGWYFNLKSIEKLPNNLQDKFYKVVAENFKVGMKTARDETKRAREITRKNMKQANPISDRDLKEMRKKTESLWDVYIKQGGESAGKIAKIIMTTNK